MTKNRANESAACLDCEQTITFKRRPMLEEIIYCPHCEAMLMVVELNPLEFEWAFMDEYDDDDYDDDED